MRSEAIEYRVGGQVFRGYLAQDETSRVGRPGVLVVHEAWGLGDHVKQSADRLAALGYVAFAVDMFGEGKMARETSEGLQWTRALRADVDTMRARIRGAFDTLIARPEVDPARVVSIGYCFGGSTSLELARSGAPVAGVVSFHGGLESVKPAESGAVKAKILVCTGADDPFIPPGKIEEFMKEMKQAGADFQVIVYGGAQHSFTTPDADARGMNGLAYNQAADRRSWDAMLGFFREIFG